MHELSIAGAIVREVTAALADRPGVRVTVVRVEVGALSGIVAPALTFGFDLARADSILADAVLEVRTVPVAVACGPCGTVVHPPDGTVVCPACGTPSADIRAGRGLQIVNVDVTDEPLPERASAASGTAS